jgi:hypothetical protein
MSYDSTCFKEYKWLPEKKRMHIVPTGDSIKHLTSIRCPCNPVEEYPGLFVHKAMDGREDFEDIAEVD